MPRFSISLKRFICFPVLPGQLMSPVRCVVPCCPQHKSATHYSASLLLTSMPRTSLHFCASIPAWTSLPILKILYPGAHISNEGYPSPDITRAFWATCKRTHTHRLHVSVPTEFGFVLLSPRGMPTLGVTFLAPGSPTSLSLSRDLESPAQPSSFIHTLLGSCALHVLSSLSLSLSATFLSLQPPHQTPG